MIDEILSKFDIIDLIWSYVGPLLAGYRPDQLVELRVPIAGRRQAPAPPGAACAEEVSRHLRRHGVRCWRRGFNRDEIVLVVPRNQARWAAWLARRDETGYVTLRQPASRWGDRRRR